MEIYRHTKIENLITLIIKHRKFIYVYKRERRKDCRFSQSNITMNIITQENTLRHN